MAAELPLAARFALACQQGDEAAFDECLGELLSTPPPAASSHSSSDGDSDDDEEDVIVTLHDGFVDVCAEGHTALLNTLLALPAGTLHLGYSDCLALRRACAGGHLGVVKALLGQPGVDPGAYYGSPLASAAAQGHVRVVQALLQQGADPGASQSASLIAAATKGHAAVVSDLLATGRVDPDGRVLTSACFSGNTATVLAVLGASEGGDLALSQAAVAEPLVRFIAGLGNDSQDAASVMDAIEGRGLSLEARGELDKALAAEGVHVAVDPPARNDAAGANCEA